MIGLEIIRVGAEGGNRLTEKEIIDCFYSIIVVEVHHFVYQICSNYLAFAYDDNKSVAWSRLDEENKSFVIDLRVIQFKMDRAILVRDTDRQ